MLTGAGPLLFAGSSMARPVPPPSAGWVLLAQGGLEPQRLAPVVFVALLLGPIVVGLFALSAVLALRKVQPSRTMADLALGAIGAGLAFQALLIGWLLTTGRYLDFLTWPLSGDASLYLSIIVGVAMGFLLIWLGVLHALVQQAGAHAQEVDDVNRKLRHRTEELEEFSYAVSHDLKSPLISLQWLVDELDEETDAEERARLTARIGEKVSQMTHLVEDLLLLARVEREGAVEAAEDVQHAAGETKDALAPLWRTRRVEVETDHLAGATVNLPAVRLRQILQNLVENALVYGSENGHVRISCHPTDQEGVVRLEVADDGPGVPESEREEIFTAFTRGRGSSAVEGSGIGLALVRKIARAYGGRAWVEEAPEGGASVNVLLPGHFVDGHGQDHEEWTLEQGPD